ncbi:U6 snRNA-associated Sm-like protein LSm4 [Enteropsectra breve]|nr:U6 snRNA-associated Sm-like protein LSm4 [Enteropsectra breve]
MYPRTLISLSKHSYITVELRNNTRIKGMVAYCDAAMNLHLKNVHIKYEDSGESYAPECYLRGPSIRTVSVNPKVLEKQRLFEK